MQFIRYLNQKRHLARAKTRAGIRGEFRLMLYDYKGRLKDDTGWFDNLITNNGLNCLTNFWDAAVGDGSWTEGLVVGSGSTPAQFTDTDLESYMGGVIHSGVLTNDYEYYGWTDPVPWMASANAGRLNAGVATGTIREVGFTAYTQPQSGTNNWVTVRQVLPTPFVKQSTDILDVWYRPYWYFNTTDQTGGPVQFDGIDYNWTMRFGGLSGSSQGSIWGTTRKDIRLYRTEVPYYSDGELAATTAFTLSDGNVSQNYAYGTTLGLTTPVDDVDFWGVLRTGINVDGVLPSNELRTMFSWNWTGQICTQIRFGKVSDDSAIPFTDKDIFDVQHRIAFERYVPDLWGTVGSFSLTGNDIATSVA